MSADPDTLYWLLPAYVRDRDGSEGHPLRDLLRVIAEQATLIEDDIGHLYANWFIETCDDWAIPYLGELIGVKHAPGACLPSRREVAHTIAYRRWSGTLAVLEQIAHDVTGWSVRAHEYGMVMEKANKKPTGVVHALQGVKQPQVFLTIWRVQAYPVSHSPACYIESGGRHGYTFSVLGNNMQLYTRPEPVGVEPERHTHVSYPLSIQELREHLDQHYGDGKSLQIWTADRQGNQTPIPIDEIIVADLSAWERQRPAPGKVAIDPTLGRIVFSPRQPHAQGVWVSYWYGLSAHIGGGPYARPAHTQPLLSASRFRADDFLDLAAQRETASGESLRLVEQLRDEATELTELIVAGHLHTAEVRRLDAAQLHLHANARHDGDIVAHYLGARDQAATRRLYEGPEASEQPPLSPYDRAEGLAALLNAALEDPTLTETIAGEGSLDAGPMSELPRALRVLVDAQPQGRALARLNRLLLEHRYPGIIPLSFERYIVSHARPANALRHYPRIRDALAAWAADSPNHAEIVLADNEVYRGDLDEEPITVELQPHQHLTISAAPGTRPVLRLIDYDSNRPDFLQVSGGPGARFTLEGLLVTGQGLQFSGPLEEVAIRHCTLVPGWSLTPDRLPLQPDGASIELLNTSARLTIDHSIVGSIQVNLSELAGEPLAVTISDSILDATSPNKEALGAPTWPYAHVALSVARSTVIGQIATQRVDMAEDSIFLGRLIARQRQTGCVRYCYLGQGSLPPATHACLHEDGSAASTRPQFISTRYSEPSYCRLTTKNDRAIKRGASDGGEMGVFHCLDESRRLDALRRACEGFLPEQYQLQLILVE